MVLTHRLKSKFLIWLITLVVGMGIGAAYSVLVYPPGSPDPCDWRVGAAIALAIGLFSMPLEIFSRELRLMIAVRNLPLGFGWLVRSAIHLLIILAAMQGVHWAFDSYVFLRPPLAGQSLANLLQDAVFCAIGLTLVVFVLEMHALLGSRVIATTLFGNYGMPAQKNRIFLLVDMVKSSDAAARLGDRAFLSYLTDTFRVVEAAVAETGGEIYTFIGDALIASWPLQEGGRNEGPLRATMRSLAALDAAAPGFQERYGTAPRLRMVLHGGPVILGQYGDMRRQVTYLGEVLNVLSRLERFAKGTPYDILVSLELLQRLAVPAGLAAAPLPSPLRNAWSDPVDIIALQRLGPEAASQLPSFAAKKPAADPQLKAAR